MYIIYNKMANKKHNSSKYIFFPANYFQDGGSNKNSGQEITKTLDQASGLLGAFTKNAKLADTNEFEEQLRASSNRIIKPLDNDALMQEYDTWNPYALTNRKQVRGSTVGQRIGNTLESAATGASMGASIGAAAGGAPAIPGAIIGAIAGLAAGISSWGTGDMLANRKSKQLNKMITFGNERRLQSLDNAAQNVDRNQDLQLQSTFYRDGGKLNFMGNGGHTNGSMWDNGITHFNEGGTHSENPFGGIIIGTDNEGTPNLVEEGEVRWKDMILSNRLKPNAKQLTAVGLNKKYEGKTFAEISKILGKESEERPNDPISKRGLELDMSKLAIIQEMHKQQNSLEDEINTFKNGGKIDFAANKGKPIKLSKAEISKLSGEEQSKLWQHNLDNSMFGNVFKAIDPTGTTSWGDVKKAWSDGKFDYNDILQPIGALPVIGKTTKIVSSIGNGLNFIDDTVKRMQERQQGNKFSSGGDLYGTDNTFGYQPFDEYAVLAENAALAEYPIVKRDVGPVLPKIDNRGILPTSVQMMNKTTPFQKQTQLHQDKMNIGTMMRYAPALGNAVMSLTDAIGLTNKPDKSTAQMLNNIPEVPFNPVGNYLVYNPLDINYHRNNLLAQTAATRRSLMSDVSPSRGANIVAADYNANMALGNLARQAEEYNLAQRAKVEEFNRGTNMFNSEGVMKAAQANAEMRMRAKLAQAELINKERERSSAAKSANLSNLFESLSGIGREQTFLNSIKSDNTLYYERLPNGKIRYKNAYNSLSEAEKKIIDAQIKNGE